MDEKRIEKLMAKLDLTREEALEMLADDADIEKGKAKDFDLTKEQQKNVKAFTNVKVHNYSLEGAKKRERKPNENKRQIVNWVRVLFEGFENNGAVSDVSVSNIERQIDFKIGTTSYSLTLTEHRQPKK